MTKRKSEYKRVVTAKPRTLRTHEDLKRPNAYAHDWAQVAMKHRRQP